MHEFMKKDKLIISFSVYMNGQECKMKEYFFFSLVLCHIVPKIV